MAMHEISVSNSDDASSTEILLAFSTLRRIREERRAAFPFLKQSLDYALLLYLGNEQAQGRLTNLNDILTSGVGTASSIIRRLSALEEVGVIRRTRSNEDRRNTFYSLTDMPLNCVQSYFDRLSTLLAHLPNIARTTEKLRAGPTSAFLPVAPGD